MRIHLMRIVKIASIFIIVCLIIFVLALFVVSVILPKNHLTDNGNGIAIELGFIPQSLESLDHFPNQSIPFLKNKDLSELKLELEEKNLVNSYFNNHTKWPTSLPYKFDPGFVLEAAKNPGLGISALHYNGFDGEGIVVGMIDRFITTDHFEYIDRIISYEEIHSYHGLDGNMGYPHGTWSLSLFVGKSVGVAPGANVHFIGAERTDQFIGVLRSIITFGHYPFLPANTYYAQALGRLLDINDEKPEGQKIRVICICAEILPNEIGYDIFMNQVARAKDQNIFIVTAPISLYCNYGFSFSGLNRDVYSDLDDDASYFIAQAAREDFNGRIGENEICLYVPMGQRTAADNTGIDDYIFMGAGYYSNAIPYIAGLYAICCQVYPDITPDLFWDAAIHTSTIIKNPGDTPFSENRVINPVDLVTLLQSW